MRSQVDSQPGHSPIAGLAWLPNRVHIRSLSPLTWIGLALLAVHLVIALAAPWLSPHSPTAIDPSQTFLVPSWQHPLGTDKFGRDVLARVLYGGQVAMGLSLVVAFLSVLLGGPLGVLLGYVGGLIDEFTMRLADAILAIPGFLLLLTIVTGFGSGYLVLVAALTFVYLPSIVRISRAAALDYVPREFVTAARARGEGIGSIVMQELLPNVFDVLMVEFAMRASWTIVAVSGLSFLGFGVQPPTPDWGLMIAENRGALSYAPWSTIGPILAISTLVIGLNLTTDGLAKALGLDRSRGAPT